MAQPQSHEPAPYGAPQPDEPARRRLRRREAVRSAPLALASKGLSHSQGYGGGSTGRPSSSSATPRSSRHFSSVHGSCVRTRDLLGRYQVGMRSKERSAGSEALASCGTQALDVADPVDWPFPSRCSVGVRSRARWKHCPPATTDNPARPRPASSASATRRRPAPWSLSRATRAPRRSGSSLRPWRRSPPPPAARRRSQ